LNAHAVGENFSSEPGGLFEEPPAMIPPVTDSVMPADAAVVQQKNGNITIVLCMLSVTMMFLYCPVRPSVHSFVWSDIITMIPDERLEQF